MEEGPYKRGRYTLLKNTCARDGVDYYSYHRFRASGASVLDNSGASTTGIQYVLGHSDRHSTEV